MCICCCFCHCCNSYSSKCIELCIFVISSISFASSILGFICVKWSHLTTASSVLLIIIIVFSTFLEISSILIIIFRHKGIINNTRNSFSKYIALTSFILSILILIISLIAESLVQTNFKEIDYPCKDLLIKNDPNVIMFRSLSLDELTKEQKIQFCKNKNQDYYAQICSNLEYTMSYLTSSILEICSLLLCFFFFNDYRRIKGKYDMELPIHDNLFINRESYSKGIIFQDKGEENVGPSERNIEQKSLGQSNVVIVSNKIESSGRKSQQLILNNNNNKENTKNNFIRNLRMEMKEALESMEEESSSKRNEKNDNNSNSEKNSESNKVNKNNDFMGDEKNKDGTKIE